MKRFIKIVCIVLALSTLMMIPVSAETEITPRASNYFHSFSTYIYKTSATKFQVWFDVVAVTGMDKLGVSEIRIQRSSDNSNWSTMFTCYPEYYPQMLDYNTAEHGSYVPYTGSTGYYYRALVVFYAKNSSGTGKLSRYTQTVYLSPTN